MCWAASAVSLTRMRLALRSSGRCFQRTHLEKQCCRLHLGLEWLWRPCILVQVDCRCGTL